MKKILLVAAFAGLLGSVAVANTKGDDKGKKENKKECKAGDKACAGEKKDCCKKKDASTGSATNGAKTAAATEKK